MNRRHVLRGAGATTTTLALAGSGISVGTDCCCGSGCEWENCCPLCADPCGTQLQ